MVGKIIEFIKLLFELRAQLDSFYGSAKQEYKFLEEVENNWYFYQLGYSISMLHIIWLPRFNYINVLLWMEPFRRENISETSLEDIGYDISFFRQCFIDLDLNFMEYMIFIKSFLVERPYIMEKFASFSLIFVGTIFQILAFVVPLLLAIAFLTLLERKILASVQGRIGPNFVGFRGLLQPIADGVKLLFKEIILPFSSSHFIFIFSPIFSFFLSLSNWAVMTYDSDYGAFSNLNLGVLYIFMISSLSVYALILGGWSSNSRYALLGGLRAAAQMISYEVSIGLIILNVVICVGSLNLSEIVFFQRDVYLIFPLFPMFIIFVISSLAETNRSPFDLPEAEGELVAGYNVEYSSITFALFFLAEYGNIIFMSFFSTILFLGGWVHGFLFFVIKVTIMVYVFVWVRAAFPRYRYDQLMQIGWKLFLPLSFSYVVFTASVLFAFDALPFL